MQPSQPIPTHVEKSPLIESKRSIVKHAFCETFESSTLHALPNVIRNEYMFMKIFWLILFFGGLGVSIYCKFLMISKYNNNPPKYYSLFLNSLRRVCNFGRIFCVRNSCECFQVFANGADIPGYNNLQCESARLYQSKYNVVLQMDSHSAASQLEHHTRNEWVRYLSGAQIHEYNKSKCVVQH